MPYDEVPFPASCAILRGLSRVSGHGTGYFGSAHLFAESDYEKAIYEKAVKLEQQNGESARKDFVVNVLAPYLDALSRNEIYKSGPDNEFFERKLKSVGSFYIADGHHRAASAVKVGIKRRNEASKVDPDAEYNYFLSVFFPDNQLKILPYNRVVRDLNGYTKEEFFEKIKEHFTVCLCDEPYSPTEKCNFGMFIDNNWYRLIGKDDIKSSDPVKGLDVSILQEYLLAPILGIEDPRTDSRIDFVGGIRGLKELERRVNSDMKVAFSMYATSINELFEVADADMLMPPKSTWFEPKLRSGIFVHKL